SGFPRILERGSAHRGVPSPQLLARRVDGARNRSMHVGHPPEAVLGERTNWKASPVFAQFLRHAEELRDFWRNQPPSRSERGCALVAHSRGGGWSNSGDLGPLSAPGRAPPVDPPTAATPGTAVLSRPVGAA